MTRIAQTTFATYAQDFWAKENRKPERRQPGYKDDLVKSIHSDKKSYKLPTNPANKNIWVVELDLPDEILNLRIHEYMLQDDWMRKYGLNISPTTNANRLENVASIILNRGFFTNVSAQNEPAVQYYNVWKSNGAYQGSSRGTLKTFYNPPDAEKPLLEVTTEGYEIIDGWGRLLPVAALLIQGVKFTPVAVYLAEP